MIHFFLVRLPFEAPEIVDDMPVDSMGVISFSVTAFVCKMLRVGGT